MYYINTRNTSERVSFKEACLNGLAKDGGLYMPENIPVLSPEFFKNIHLKSDLEIATHVLKPFVEHTLTEFELQNIIQKTLTFPTPVIPLSEQVYSLELFHGPTKAFKDIGARFMAGCLSVFADKTRKTHVLVATSGDTGSAVAQGFYKVPHVHVTILFPKGKISPFQEYQMCSLGNNIGTLEVDGNFDDCQNLVKQAFSDKSISKTLNLSSANSINIARLLPQMIYYFLGYKQLQHKLINKPWIVSVPSGNFGNITAGLIAKKMGLPIEKLIAANNVNDPFHHYLQHGIYTKKTALESYSNAMDVGAPSNFERLQHLYPKGYLSMREDLQSVSVSDADTLKQMKQTYKTKGYILDPHGAVGLIGLNQFININCIGTFLETASPEKFDSVVQKVIPEFKSTALNSTVYTTEQIPNNYKVLTTYLLNNSN